ESRSTTNVQYEHWYSCSSVCIRPPHLGHCSSVSSTPPPSGEFFRISSSGLKPADPTFECAHDVDASSRAAISVGAAAAELSALLAALSTPYGSVVVFRTAHFRATTAADE